MNININAKRIEMITATAITAMLCIHYSKAYFSHALILLALFFIYILIKKGRHSLSETLFEKNPPAAFFSASLAIFYGALSLSTAVNQDIPGLHKALSYAALAIPFFMTYTLGRLTKSEMAMRCGFLLAAFIIGSYAPFADPEFYHERLYSFFAHPNHLGTYTALFLPFVFLYLYRTNTFWKKIILTFLALLLLYCLWKSGSRGAIAAFAGGIFLSLLTLLFAKRKSLSAKKSFTAILIALLLLTSGGALVHHITTERTKNPWSTVTEQISPIKFGGGERLLMWKTSIKMWGDHKLSGVGLSDWETAYYSDTYHPKEGIEKELDMPHNMPLYFLSTAGLIGAAGYAAFLLLSFAALYKSMKQAADPLFSAAALSASFAFAIQGLVDTTIINTIPTRIYFALMGYYFSCYNGLIFKNAINTLFFKTF